MKIYRGRLELLDYVFYATVERGKVYETGGFIHNYALTYAFSLVRADSYTYTYLTQRPNYEEELVPLNQAIYLTPARPDAITYRLVQWNTVSDGYALPRKQPSIGYPDWGWARVLRPGSTFGFYMMVRDESRLPDAPPLHNALQGHQTRIRVGKFPGKVGVQLWPADKVREKIGGFTTRTMVNWHDVGDDPVVCDVVPISLPTRLIENAVFEKTPYIEATFGEESICLPSNMSFFARTRSSQHRTR